MDQRPEYTEGYEGFFHLIAFNGSVEEADIAYIIRDHDRAKFEAKKVMMGQAVDFINQKYGEGTAALNLRDQYYNMREQVEPHYFVVEKAVKAMEMAGFPAKIQPIRGREPLLQGPPLPEHLRRRPELPRQDGVRPAGKHGLRLQGHPEHHFPLRGVGFPGKSVLWRRSA